MAEFALVGEGGVILNEGFYREREMEKKLNRGCVLSKFEFIEIERVQARNLAKGHQPISF